MKLYILTGYSIKQHDTVEYLGCQRDSKLNGEALASNVLRKINAKLKFFYQKSIYLIPAFRRLLCNALIQLLCTSSFRGKFKDQTSKHSKQIYSFLHKNIFIFACLFIIHNTISLLRHEQVCLSGLRFERYFSHLQAT